MKHTLRQKYSTVGCLLILGFLGCLMLMSGALKESVAESWNRRNMHKIAADMVRAWMELDGEISRENMDVLASDHDVSIALINEKRKVLASTRSWEVTSGVLGEKTLLTIKEKLGEVKHSGSSFTSYFDDNNGAFFVEIDQAPGYGYVLVRKSITGFNSSLKVMQICFWIAGGITLLCGTLIIVNLSGKMVQPILEINKVTGQIAKLNFDEKVTVDSKDELGTLAESVNSMSDQLKKSMGELQREVDMRKALVRNMTHELKTPVAVIMGYAENMPMIKDQPEKLEKYCEIIAQECVRMDGLIQQMLENSSYEQGEGVLNKTRFSVQSLLDCIRRCYEDEFPERKGTYTEKNEVREEILGDMEVIQRAIYNFVKNAVCYGKKDGEIRLHAWEDEKTVHFSVFNEGDPITPEDQEKIWDVFYKVNPARTRNSKSFGIGLSIVKQAALAHGGSVGVQNKDRGVEFLFSIKK